MSTRAPIGGNHDAPWRSSLGVVSVEDDAGRRPWRGESGPWSDRRPPWAGPWSEACTQRTRLTSADRGYDSGMQRVGLCLGAGGTVGQAYHAGVLAALQIDVGCDARSADIVVSTSAGSLTGAMLRAGTAPLDLASWVLGRNWEPGQPLLEGLDAVRKSLPPLEMRALLRRWHLPTLQTWAPRMRRPWVFRPMAIAASMLPHGTTSLEALIARHMAGRVPEEWPSDLWVCAVRRSDGRRIVFGQVADEPTSLPLAIAASSCIPGYFAPVLIKGTEFLDGGIHSPTNADLLAKEELDVVIVISPMSGGDGIVDRAFRVFAQQHLDEEVQRLEEAGTRVIRFEPGPTSSRAMGHNPMAADRAGRVVQAAFFEAGARVSRPDLRRILLSAGRDAVSS